MIRCSYKHTGAAFSHIAPEVTARTCLAGTERSKSLLEQASVSKTHRQDCFSHNAKLGRARQPPGSYSLLGHGSKPLIVRNRCSSTLLCNRQHSKTLHQCCLSAHCAQARTASTGCSKSLSGAIGRASKPLTARNRCSSKLLFIRQHFRVSFVLF